MRERSVGMVVARDGGSGSALVEIEQTAQPLGFSNGPVGRTGCLAGEGDELGPGGVTLAFWCRTQSLSLQNIADGLVGSVIPQISQGAYNSVITSTWVLPAELEHPLFNLK